MNSIIFLIFLFLLLVVRHRYYWMVPGHLRFTDSVPFLISHRGYKKKHPENTIEAYMDAEKENFNWIELDVISTKDGVVVCSHNFDLERETDGSGYISEIDHLDLNSINVGFNNQKLHHYRIPTLIDVFDNLRKSTKVNIEIKAPLAHDLSTARALGKLIKDLPTDRIIISSFNPFVILYFRLLYRRVVTGFLYQNVEYFWFTNWIHPSYLHPRADLVDDSLIEFAKKKNIGINVWTINNKGSYLWCNRKKLDGIITDRRPDSW